jgi:mannose-6-phosphate isomerase
MSSLYPLRFRPILRDYLWGGRRLETLLGKPLPPGDRWAESWEIADHGSDQSVVEFGALAGTTLNELVANRGIDLLGAGWRAAEGRFPLLLKFLDAAQTLSVQVHPDDARAARLDPPDGGKTEAWVVLDVLPGSLIYAGLKPGIDRATFEAALHAGRCADCLHSFQPSPGDCVYVPAGAVHALGAGLLVAEVQQTSDVTYRLFDWNRVASDGRPRALHIEQGLEAIDFSLGPIEPQWAEPTERIEVVRLVACDKFVLDRWDFDTPQPIGGDGRCRLIAVLDGAVSIEGDPSGVPLRRGASALLPAGSGATLLSPLPGRRVELLAATVPS